MDAEKSRELYVKACKFWEFLRDSYSPDEDEWERGIDVILGDLKKALKADPNNLDARRLRVEMIGDQLGAYVEALAEADKLVSQAPDNPAFRELQTRMRRQVKKGREADG